MAMFFQLEISVLSPLFAHVTRKQVIHHERAMVDKETSLVGSTRLML